MKNKIRERLERLLATPEYRPQNKSELARTLELHPKDRSALRALLKDLEKRGKINRTKRGRYAVGGSSGGTKSKEPAGSAGQKSGRDRSGRSQSGGSDRRGSGGKSMNLVGQLYFRDSDRGGAWFVPDLKAPENENSRIPLDRDTRIAVDSRDTLTALHGDRVLVRVDANSFPAWWKHVPQKRKRMERMKSTGAERLSARVSKILERGTRGIVGTYYERHQGKAKGGSGGNSSRGGRGGRVFRYVKPDSALLPASIDIPDPEPVKNKDRPQDKDTQYSHPKDGAKVVVEVTDWPSRNQPPQGRILEVLGMPGDPGVDILGIIHALGIRTAFPPDVLAEAEAIPDHVPTEVAAKREDWRDRFVFTIDPTDARDFDDAIAVSDREDGGWDLAVHIADVSHYVKPGSALDREAERRGNSTYLADRVLPMLPESLSNGICSLKPEVERLTRGAEITFDAKGKPIKTRFFSGIIRSRHRLTYQEAHARIKDPNLDRSNDPLDQSIHTAWALASNLRSRRFAQGALDLDFPEVRAVLDDRGKPIELKRIDHDESHQLIEECMLAANEAVARKLTSSQTPAVYRVHEDPDEAKLHAFRDLAKVYGYDLPDATNRQAINSLLRKAQGRPEAHALKVALLKSMKRAAYHPDSLGHYGLAKANYTHFTSPIRRYADLIVHRALFPDPDHPNPAYGDMGKIATHISKTERISADAEMESQKLKQLEYFAGVLKSAPDTTFRGTVVDVRRMGIFVELQESMMRGLSRPRDFPRGDWYFDAGHLAFRCRQPRRSLGVGDEVDVTISHLDFTLKRLDFSVV